MVLFSGVAFADNITLNNPETLSTPTSNTISNWKITELNATAKRLVVQYQWTDADKNVIKLRNSSGWNSWTCQDIAAVPAFDVATCTGVDTPDPCCTGAGTGEGCFEGTPAVTCFSDIFGFQIRSQDVGTKIGVGLRTLIWNKFKSQVLSTGNAGTFDTN